jgi:hypothetical protein
LAQSQSPQRTTAKSARINASLTEPLRITPFTLKTDANQHGRSSPGDNGWISRPLIQVENISGKTIEYLVIEISFASTEGMSAQSPLMLAYGQAPGQKSSSRPPEALQPGARINLTIDRNAGATVKTRLLASGTRPPSGSRAATRINGVVFADRTALVDGLLHVADPDNPLRWNVVEQRPSQASLNDVPLFNMAHASFRTLKVSRREQCWKRMGTEWVTCCDGFPVMASAILIQMFGGIYEPFYMSTNCPDGETTCDWVKAVGCSYDPWDPGED